MRYPQLPIATFTDVYWGFFLCFWRGAGDKQAGVGLNIPQGAVVTVPDAESCASGVQGQGGNGLNTSA